MRRSAIVLLALLLVTVPLAGDDLTVQVDPQADLSVFATFAMRDGKVNSSRPELDNPLFAKKLSSTIRAALLTRGLKETTASSDLVVDYALTGQDFSMAAPTAVRGAGPRPVRYTQGTLVISLTKRGDVNPVWRGIYRDDEETGSKLVIKLPEDAKKLIDRYPRRAK